MLSDIIQTVRDYPGLKRKHAISKFVKILDPVQDIGDTVVGFGDDAAVLRLDVKLSDHYLIFSSDGIWSKLHIDPFWAGYCSVLVNVNDIYAMGGNPIAMTNNVSYTSEEEGELIAKGMADACQKFNVAMVGGHVHPDSDFLSISVSIVGKAKNVITSTDCKEEDDLILAIDLDGKKRGEFLNWDSTSHKPSGVVQNQLRALIEIAEKSLANAGKDISNPGVLGTIGMLLETSGKGAAVDLDAIPKPNDIDVGEWILMYPGFGFVLSSQKGKTKEILDIFRVRNVEARVVGSITKERKMTLRKGDEEELLFDFTKDSITGIKKG
jgi:putative methanogenesis marker protein 2